MANQRETDPNEHANDVLEMVCEFLDELLFGELDHDPEFVLPTTNEGIVALVANAMGRTELTRKAVTVAAIKWAEAKERSEVRS